MLTLCFSYDSFFHVLTSFFHMETSQLITQKATRDNFIVWVDQKTLDTVSASVMNAVYFTEVGPLSNLVFIPPEGKKGFAASMMGVSSLSINVCFL